MDPGRLQTLEQHPRSASKRLRIEECLPEDSLEAIMGFLDRETLCTARLVSKTFCTAASAHVCSLTLRSTSEAVSFHRYPHLQHVTVRHAYPNFPKTVRDAHPHLRSMMDSLAQLTPRLRDLATALTIGGPAPSPLQTRDFLSQAALMPKLRRLEVADDVHCEAALLARCTNLEAIDFRSCSMSVAKAIVTMTRLTSLDVGSVSNDDRFGRRADIFWLGDATNLRCLQALRIIQIDAEELPLIGNLTGLTGLTVSTREEEETGSIAPLTRLTRLRSLRIGWGLGDSNLGIACSLGSGSLVNLDLAASQEASADCGRMLSRQTALTRLRLQGQQFGNLQHIGALRNELLQCLEIDDVEELDAESLLVLCRATSLTKLCIGTDSVEVQEGLSPALAQLTHLHSLKLQTWFNIPDFVDFPRALSPLTALTELTIYSHALHDGDLRALLVLTGLRVLDLAKCRLTDDVLPELGLLTNLHTLKVEDCDLMSLAPVSEVLDPLRKARGLPPLDTTFWPLLPPL